VLLLLLLLEYVFGAGVSVMGLALGVKEENRQAFMGM
jgi:hypothetical protein